MSDAISSPDSPDLPRLGSYRIVRPLGSGGMSNVFQAIHDESGSVVALKVLPRKLAQNVVLLQRFLKEARSAENLDHPNIVAIYDRGFDQGRHYLVLEFVEGRDLYDRVRLNGVLTPRDAVAFIREIALGLQYAAGQGMIHRDVKPANLLMTPDGQAKIIDLGLALQADDEDERVTRDGTTVGTVDYMSPEQARDSRKINERSDIYSLGCTFHYLLTGSAPYPGGNLADKLARHHSATIPDVRERNPEVPADLALLVQKMMAKKPEQRFGDYNELIQALDRIRFDGSQIAPVPIDDVLIDDSAEVEGDSRELTRASATSPRSAKPASPLKPQERSTASNPAGLLPEQNPGFSLADLAALDSDERSDSTRGRGIKPKTLPGSKSSALAEAIFDEAADDSDVVPLGRAGGELPLQTWIAAGIMVGVVIAIIGFGIRFAISMMKPTETDQTVVSVDGLPSEIAGNEERTTSAISPRASNSAPVKPAPSVNSIRKASDRVASGTVSREGSGSTTLPPPVEVAFPQELMARLGISKSVDRPVVEPSGRVVVRRLVEAGDSAQTNSLANAFGRSNDEIEIADVGPFHEDDYQIAGKSRIIRGRAGTRPILKIEFTRQPLVRDLEAKFMLGLNGVEQLTIEGIDLVVDVRDLPLAQSTLFLCQGVDLTLRDCSITIANVDDRRNGFSVFRLTNGPRPNRLRIERSLIRGPIQTLAQVVSGQADLTLDRTVVVGSNGPLFQFEASERSERSVELYRSIFATRGTMFLWNGKPSPTSIRSLGSTFGHVESTSIATTSYPWMMARNVVEGDLKTWLDYDGEANRWIGWSTIAQWGTSTGPPSRVAEDLRAVWPPAEQESREDPASWPSLMVEEKVTAATYSQILPDQSATLMMVANPHPSLFELTVDLFQPLPAPELLDDFGSEIASSEPRKTVSLYFDALTSSQVDLGRFLQEQVSDGSKRYVVRVQGTGSYPMSPVRLPDGVSVVILGPPGDGSSSPVPVFVASKSGLALIELHGGDLAISNLGFATDGVIRTRHWLSLGGSLLALRRCRYRDIGASGEPAGAAIAFEARETRPIPTRSGGFRMATNRPIAALKNCWIGTTAEAIFAEVGRGVVQLENCLIQAGIAAIRLKLAFTRPGDFEADLILENCTLVDDRFGVVLDPTQGGEMVVSRPWLVLSRASVFPRIAREGGALLGVDPAIFARGALFWQSSNDLYEVSRFLAANGPSTIAVTASPDLKRQWVDLWGINHTRNDRGPDAKKLERIIHFRDKDRSRTSRPTLNQLELDPKLHGKQGVNFKALPPIPRP